MTRPRLDPKATKRTLRRLHGEPVQAEEKVHDGAARSGELEPPDRLTRLWRALEPPQTSDLPPDFAAQITAPLRHRQVAGSSSVSPAWTRTAAVAALAAGLLLGVGVGSRAMQPGTDLLEDWSEDWSEESLTEGDRTGGHWADEDWTEAWSEAYESSFGDSVTLEVTGNDS